MHFFSLARKIKYEFNPAGLGSERNKETVRFTTGHFETSNDLFLMFHRQSAFAYFICKYFTYTRTKWVFIQPMDSFDRYAAISIFAILNCKRTRSFCFRVHVFAFRSRILFDGIWLNGTCR